MDHVLIMNKRKSLRITYETVKQLLKHHCAWTDPSRRDHRGCPRRLPVWSSTQTSVWLRWCWPRSGCLVSSASTYSSYCLWSRGDHREDLILDAPWGVLINTVNIQCFPSKHIVCILQALEISWVHFLLHKMLNLLVEHKIETSYLLIHASLHRTTNGQNVYLNRAPLTIATKCTTRAINMSPTAPHPTIKLVFG